MPDDIEDFLKRAAQRRQAKNASTPPPASPKPATTPRPEYTNARSERVVRPRVDDEVPLQAVLVDDEAKRELKRQAQRAANAASQSQAAALSQRATEPLTISAPAPAAPGVLATGSSMPASHSTSTADRLIAMLRQPDGLAQVFLLQEILKRPEENW